VELNTRFPGGFPLSLAAGIDLGGGYVELMADRRGEVPRTSVAFDSVSSS
jgi:hypothetical protein